jgi:hypothetical protein
LLGRQPRIASLRHGGAKNVKTADVLVLRCDAAK